MGVVQIGQCTRGKPSTTGAARARRVAAPLGQSVIIIHRRTRNTFITRDIITVRAGVQPSTTGAARARAGLQPS